MSAPSFLTEAPVNAPATPSSMIRVRGEYKKVQQVVEQLGSKVSQVLAKQEHDFLGAYRAHMYNVQKDLQSLRSELAAKESALANDERMKKMEEECDWYRKESLRLDALLEVAKKNERFLKDKMHMLEDDRNWLAKQLKSSKKQNKLVKAEMELQLREGTDVAASSPITLTLPNVRPSSSGNPGGGSSSPHARTSNNNNQFDSSNNNNNNTQTLSNSRSAHSFPANNNNNTNSSSEVTHLTAKLETLKAELRLVRSQRDADRRSLSSLRASSVHTVQSKGDLEEFFLDCVEDVKTTIDRRRRRAKERAAQGGAPGAGGGNGSNNSRGEMGGGAAEEERVRRAKEMLARPVELHDFLQEDRRAVIEALLAKDEVLSYLYDAVFPNKTDGRKGERVEVGPQDDLATLLGMVGRGGSK